MWISIHLPSKHCRECGYGETAPITGRLNGDRLRLRRRGNDTLIKLVINVITESLD